VEYRYRYFLQLGVQFRNNGLQVVFDVQIHDKWLITKLYIYGVLFIVNASLFEFTRKITPGRHEQQPISRIQGRRSIFISIISDITCCNQTKLPIFKRKFGDIKGIFRDRKLEKTNNAMTK
jgi:hypothetical protein